MKKKKLRGFTLIECIIAMMILGVASLLIVQSYVQLMNITNMNNTISESIANQMADAEARADGNTKMISPDINKATYDSSQGMTFTITKCKDNDLTKEDTNAKYVTNVEVYCVYPYEYGSQKSSPSKSGTDVRYIYFHR